MKKSLWIVPLILVLCIVGYALAKAAQYGGQWKQFQAAWQRVTPQVSGTPGYSWTPGLFSAVGEMDFSSSRLTDEDLATVVPLLRDVETLSILKLSDSEVTDAGVAALADFRALREVHLVNTAVTAEGVAALREKLVDCTIVH